MNALYSAKRMKKSIRSINFRRLVFCAACGRSSELKMEHFEIINTWGKCNGRSVK